MGISNNAISKLDPQKTITTEPSTMLDHNSNVADSTANVINTVQISQPELKTITVLRIIVVVLLCAIMTTKLYKLHNRCLKKRYLSNALDLDKV